MDDPYYICQEDSDINLEFLDPFPVLSVCNHQVPVVTSADPSEFGETEFEFPFLGPISVGFIQPFEVLPKAKKMRYTLLKRHLKRKAAALAREAEQHANQHLEPLDRLP